MTKPIINLHKDMRKILVIAAFFITAATCWVACKKDAVTSSPNSGIPISKTNIDASALNNVKVIDGVLHLSEGDRAFDEITALLALSNQEYANWASANSFKSLGMAFENATNDVAQAATEAEYRAALDKHNDLLKLVMDEVEPRVKAGVYRRIANAQGYYFAGQSAFRIVDDNAVEARDGDISKLASAQRIVVTDAAKDIYVNPIFETSIVVERDGGCGTCPTSYCQTTDRRVNLSICIVNCYSCCGGVRKQIQPRVWGQKKNVWGNWTGYNTVLSFEYVGYEIRDQFGTVQSYDNWNESTDPNEQAELIGYNWIDPQPCYSGCQTGNQFLKVKGNGHSRGVGYGRWAKICCGYLNGVGCPPSPLYSCQ
jgi:hypothetical protein